jgi:hypothetical protein
LQEHLEDLENPDAQTPMKLYLESAFKEYVKEKYFVENAEIL